MASPLNLLFLFLLVGEYTKEKGPHIETKPIEEMRVVPLIVQGDTVITNLDALIECEIYRGLGYEFRCWWDDEEKVKLYSVLLFLRKRFEKLIGIEDEIAKSMIDNKMKRTVVIYKESRDEEPADKLIDERGKTKYDKDERNNELHEMFRKIGLSEHHIRREKIKTRIFISKVKKNFLVDIEDLKSIIEERFMRSNDDEKDKDENEKNKNRRKSRKRKRKKIVMREEINKLKKKGEGSTRGIQEDDQEYIIRREMEEIEEKITQEFINLLIPPDTKFYFE